MPDDRSKQHKVLLLTRGHLSALPQIHERLTPSERELLLGEGKLEESRNRTMKEAAPGSDIWVFGYGSLIWNPIFQVTATLPATVHGYHRSLCMNSVLGRGSIDNPGAMLALDVGGACKGVVMKVGGDVPSELKLLWRREMMSGAYHPKWVNAKADGTSIRAISFVANRASSHYAGRLSDEEIGRRLATASGIWGSNLDYVERTQESLDAHGIHDVALTRILKLQARQIAQPSTALPHSEME